MPQPDDQPWSPFPVQDWSSLPEDPLAATRVDPNWAPPERHGPWWRPLVVFAVVAALIAGTAYVANSVGIFAPATAATEFLPRDGDVRYERIQTAQEDLRTVGMAATESARFSGESSVLSVDGEFSARLAPQVVGNDSISVWRTIRTPIGSSVPTPQTVRFFRVTSGVELLGESTPTEAYVYDPGLVLLPAGVREGSHWSGAGSAGEYLDYRSELRAGPAERDCLEVAGEVRYFDKRGQPGRVVTLAQTWCPHQGITLETESSGDTRTIADGSTPPGAGQQATASTPIRWTTPERWTAKQGTTTSTNRTYGAGPMVGTPRSSVPPVRTESGLVVRATYGHGDLVATKPVTFTSWTSVWRTHPGGTVLTLAAFGNVIIATTSSREVVAYSDAGVRLWTLRTDDLAPTPAVRADDQDAVLVDLTGTVRQLDVATGAVVWQASVGADVDVAPVAGAGLVVIMDRGGTTTAYDLGSGTKRWDAPLQGRGAAVIGDTVVVLQDQAAHALAADTGRHRWVRNFFGTFTTLASFAGNVVVATKSGSVIIDGNGAVRKRLDPALALTATQDHLVAWGTTEAQVLTTDGTQRARWTLPPLTLAQQDRVALALPDGVLLFNNDWTFEVRVG
jgi:PQQ-like domain